ncbi:MAG: TrmH family RNA methyltransferase [Steroidobacteraceae bacterium]
MPTQLDLRAWLSGVQQKRLVIVETGSTMALSDLAIAPDECLLFGSESRGLPPAVADRAGVPTVHVSLPMRPSNRSLNLSNAVAITVYEAWRQNGFVGGAPHVTRTPP